MPYKISIWIVLFLLFFNAGAGLLAASGAGEYLGVEPETGNQEQLEAAKGNVSDYETGNGEGGTLFGLYNSLSSPLESVFNAVMPGAAMLKNVGVPVYLVNFLFAGLAIIPGIDLMMFLRSG